MASSLLPPSFWSAVHRLTTNEPWPPTTPASAKLFIEKCAEHGLLSLLFAETELPPAVEDARNAAKGWQRILATRGRLFHDAILAVCRILVGDPSVLIKGADYEHRLYPDWCLRPMQDIDVLVQASRFEPVCRRIQDAGFVPMPVAGAALHPAHHERAFLFGNFLIEIHQTFIQRPRHRIDYDAIWQRCVPLELGGHRASRLDDVDALAYHALSMAIDEFHVRFIRYVDLWLLLRQGDGIALAAAERARDWQTARALYGALSQACRMFPEFHTSDVGAAMTRALSAPARAFVDRWVLPAPSEVRRFGRKRRVLQLWRKAWLMDTSARRAAFALYHAAATVHGWRSARANRTNLEG